MKNILLLGYVVVTLLECSSCRLLGPKKTMVG